MIDRPSQPSERRDLVPVGPAPVATRFAAARAAPPPGSGITPAFIIRSLLRWALLTVPISLVLGGAAAAIAWLTFQPTYMAEAWIRIEDRRPYVAFPSQEESKRFAQTQVEMIRSPVVLSYCLTQPEIAQLPELKGELDPVQWLSTRLGITSVGESELFRVRFQGPNPDNAAKIANAIIQAYLKRHSSDAREETQKVIDVLEIEKGNRIRELQRLQENVRALTKQVTGKDMSAGKHGDDHGKGAHPLAALEERLTVVEVEREVLDAQYKAASQAVTQKQDVQVPSMALEQAVATDAEVSAMTTEMTRQRLLLREYEHASAQPQQVDAVKKLNKRIAALEKDLDQRKDEVRKLRTKDLQQNVSKDRRVALQELKAKVDSQRMLEKGLRERLESGRGEMEKFGDQALNLEFARSEMERAEEVYRRISDRTTALQTEQSAQARVSLWSPAAAPTVPLTTPVKFVAAVAGACFSIPFALALLWELRVRRISSVDQIQDETRLPVLGEITSLPARSVLPGRNSVARFERHRSAFEESVAALRTCLMVGEDVGNVRVIAVASAVSREGKTSVATQLATNIANASGEPTLLIDADLRNPQVHEMFGVELGPGLTEILSGQATADDCIVAPWNRRVQILPAGVLKGNPHALFNHSTFPVVLQALRAEYRYIVIDCPPLLAASEALVVAKAADGVLLCTMRDVSRVTHVRQARERLTLAGARPLGVVFSGVSPRSYAARYGGYGYAGADVEVATGEAASHHFEQEEESS